MESLLEMVLVEARDVSERLGTEADVLASWIEEHARLKQQVGGTNGWKDNLAEAEREAVAAATLEMFDGTGPLVDPKTGKPLASTGPLFKPVLDKFVSDWPDVVQAKSNLSEAEMRLAMAASEMEGLVGVVSALKARAYLLAGILNAIAGK